MVWLHSLHVSVSAAGCHVLPQAIWTFCSLSVVRTGRTMQPRLRSPTQHGYLAALCPSTGTHMLTEAFSVNLNSSTTTAALFLHWSDKTSVDSLIRHIWYLPEAGVMSGRWQTGWQLWDDVCVPERTNAPLTELPLVFCSDFHHKWLQIWGEEKVTKSAESIVNNMINEYCVDGIR